MDLSVFAVFFHDWVISEHDWQESLLLLLLVGPVLTEQILSLTYCIQTKIIFGCVIESGLMRGPTQWFCASGWPCQVWFCDMDLCCLGGCEFGSQPRSVSLIGARCMIDLVLIWPLVCLCWMQFCHKISQLLIIIDILIDSYTQHNNNRVVRKLRTALDVFNLSVCLCLDILNISLTVNAFNDILEHLAETFRYLYLWISQMYDHNSSFPAMSAPKWTMFIH